MALSHEKLDVYRLALAVARAAARQPVPTWRRHLRDQLVRAADSVVLNIAEASGRPAGSDARRNHFRIAAGSTAEVAAVFDLLDPPDLAARKADLERVAAMLARLGGR